MGSTLVMAVVQGGRARIVNVGDSRAYLIRTAETGGGPFILQLTEEHTRLAEMRRAGQPVSAQDEARLQGVLSRNIGYQPEAQVAFTAGDLQPGDFLLLCCDGLTDVLSDQQILEIVLNNRPDYLQYICWQLINAANLASGHDNITTILYRKAF
jgi:protein phosphatase